MIRKGNVLLHYIRFIINSFGCKPFHRYTFYIITSLLSWVVVKKSNFVVFDGYARCDNIRVLLQHFKSNCLASISIGPEGDVQPFTLVAAWHLARCKWLVIDAHCHFLGPNPFRLAYNIDYFDVWHATGLKCILNGSDSTKSILGYLWYGWRRTIIASGDEDAKLKKSGYGPLARIVALGSPQTDRLALNIEDDRFSQAKTKILYAPSFFDAGKDMLDPLISHNLSDINKLMGSLNAELTIKYHPLCTAELSVECFDHIKAWDNSLETNEDIKAFDILVSDYSGVICDFALLARPIIIIDNSAIRTRQLWYDLYELFPSCMVKDYQQFKDLLSELLKANTKHDIICKEVRQASQKFHNFHDGVACERISGYLMNATHRSS